MTAAFEELVSGMDVPMLVVTAWSEGERSGCLVGFSTQASIRPPRYLVLLSKKNHTYQVARSALTLGVHVLRGSDHAVAAHFGELTGDEVDKFAGLDGLEGIDVVEGPGRTPILMGLDWFVGRVLSTFDAGDHTAFLLAPHGGSAARSEERQLSLLDVIDLDAGHDA